MSPTFFQHNATNDVLGDAKPLAERLLADPAIGVGLPNYSDGIVK